jgi:hypothetical protein
MAVRHSTEEQIRSRAHQLYLEHGSQPEHGLDDWLQAEYELMQLPIRKIAYLEMPKPKKGSKLSLVALIQAAIVLGAGTLPYLKR